MNPNIYFDVGALVSATQGFVDNAMTLFWWSLGPVSILAVVYLVIALAHRR